MKSPTLNLLAAAAVTGVALAIAPSAALAASTVTVQLTDKGTAKPMAMGLAYATPGMNMANATASLVLSQTSVPAGDVTFNVTNASRELVHEMLVVFLPDAGKKLPYVAEESAADEDKMDVRGEVSELDPGKAGTVTLNLQPGTYLLLCNVPGHFEAGMWATFKVTK